MFNAQMDAISKVDSLQSDFDEIKRSARAGAQMPESVDHEDLLTAEKILAAVEQIGPEHSFAFYRVLAASSSATARVHAAEHLVTDPDRTEAIKLLKGLLPDSDPRVRGHAALSLIQLNDQSGEPVFLELLNQIGEDSVGNIDWLEQLDAKTNRQQRAFADKTLRNLSTRSASPDFHAKVKQLLAP